MALALALAVAQPVAVKVAAAVACNIFLLKNERNMIRQKLHSYIIYIYTAVYICVCVCLCVCIRCISTLAYKLYIRPRAVGQNHPTYWPHIRIVCCHGTGLSSLKTNPPLRLPAQVLPCAYPGSHFVGYRKATTKIQEHHHHHQQHQDKLEVSKRVPYLYFVYR